MVDMDDNGLPTHGFCLFDYFLAVCLFVGGLVIQCHPCQPLSSFVIQYHLLSFKMSSIVIHCHPMSSIVIHCHPLSCIVMQCHPLSSIVIHCHPLSSISIHLTFDWLIWLLFSTLSLMGVRASTYGFKWFDLISRLWEPGFSIPHSSLLVWSKFGGYLRMLVARVLYGC